MSKLIFLKPYFKEVLWANNNLQKLYNLDFLAGEAWLISAFEDQASLILNTEIKEKNLYHFFKNNKEFFGNYQGEYPNLTKFIDAKSDLSIQVHPDDKNAKQLHNSLGKDECWYVLKTSDFPFVIGSKLTSKKKIKQKIEKKIFDFLNFVNLKTDEFTYIKSGMLHGIPKNSFVFELQQSSDITYRFYDYDRKNKNNQLRELHLDLAFKSLKPKLKPKIVRQKNLLIKNKYFYLEKNEINFKINKRLKKDFFWAEVTVVKGEGKVDNFNVKFGDVFLIKNKTKSLTFEGKMTILINYVIKQKEQNL
ncbi:type I phosphomannose isomerase catalytic subunit [Mesomycoplasma hyorhinis]|uniref:type I phosphomannose isomerase catalytic subunit n=1 Tax=Mesomycoplasma hyorhinis TaxID=2100 RepID=UPI001C047797|nr:type I phosphomannose isomerase catalytic subunit [Mesomycoplasma hyorhinis]